MIVKTYQSHAVLNILKQGTVYYARRNLGFDAAYQGLIGLLGLHCAAPVFGYLKGRRSCTNGKISSSVLLILNVPADCVWLTEFNDWADYMYSVMHHTIAANRKMIIPNEEITQQHFNALQKSLQTQRDLNDYHIPQAVLEKIEPQWLLRYVDYTRSPLHRFFDSLSAQK